VENNATRQPKQAGRKIFALASWCAVLAIKQRYKSVRSHDDLGQNRLTKFLDGTRLNRRRGMEAVGRSSARDVTD